MTDSSNSERDISYPTLVKLIKKTFTSAISLNKSFSVDPCVLSLSQPYLNYYEATSFYGFIASLNTAHLSKLILKSTLLLLKRPRITIEAPCDIQFLLFILENPALQLSFDYYASIEVAQDDSTESLAYQVLERTVSILAHSPQICRQYLFNWITRYPEASFNYKVELINALIFHQLVEYYGISSQKKCYKQYFAQLIEQLKSPSRNWKFSNKMRFSSRFTLNLKPSLLQLPSLSEFTNIASASFNSFSPLTFAPFKLKNWRSKEKVLSYGSDWKLVAFARLQALFFNANLITEKIPTSAFYNILVDYINVELDFDAWKATGFPRTFETKNYEHTNMSTLVSSSNFKLSSDLMSNNHSWAFSPTFTFCQYPFLLSVSQKTQILEYYARRQMDQKAQEAFSASKKNKRFSSPYLYIVVRRSHILQDSLDFLLSHESELEKGITVKFEDESGIDAGGLRKEWFLLLVRELFAAEKELFKENEESKYYWFNLSSLHQVKFYKLTGIILGLALYNSTILDINFPPVLYKLLLGKKYSIKDFKEFQPTFGASLESLLNYEGDDFENVFELTFSVTRINDIGVPVDIELITDGLKTSVTKSNRDFYVDKIIKHHFEIEVKPAIYAMKSGFYKVLGHNVITLFQPCEIENLLCGSNEPINVADLKDITYYKDWSQYYTDENEASVICWFWEHLESLENENLRKLLIFVTGSDRIPATGISTMQFTITRLGGDSNRFPISHTCFNELCLYEYNTKQKLIKKLTMAVEESEGFGLK